VTVLCCLVDVTVFCSLDDVTLLCCLDDVSVLSFSFSSVIIFCLVFCCQLKWRVSRYKLCRFQNINSNNKQNEAKFSVMWLPIKRHGALLWCISSRFSVQCEGIIQCVPNGTLLIECVCHGHPSVRISTCVGKINKECTCVCTSRW